MILLRSHHAFCRIAKLDRQQTAFLPELVTVSESQAHLLEEDGRFSILNKTFVALFSLNGQMYLQLDAECLKVSDALSVAWGKGEKPVSRWITIKNKNSQVWSLAYEPEYREAIEFDFTPYIDDEQYDFGRWLANVLNSKTRKKVFLNPSGSL